MPTSTLDLEKEMQANQRKKAIEEELAKRQRIEAIKAEIAKREAEAVTQAQSSPPAPDQSSQEPQTPPAAAIPEAPVAPESSAPPAPQVAFSPTPEQQSNMQKNFDMMRQLGNATQSPAKSGLAKFGEEMATVEAGELAGRAVGGGAGVPLGPGGVAIGSVLGGATGGAAALYALQKKRGEVNYGDLALQFGMSLIPGPIAEMTAKGVRRLAAGTKEGIQAGMDVVAPTLKESVKRIMNPKTAQYEDAIWSLVRSSGVQMSPGAFRNGVRGLTDRQWSLVKRELVKIGQDPAEKFPQIGEKAVQAFESIRTGKPAPGMDIGALNHIRSQLVSKFIGKEGGDKSLKDAIMAFSDTISDGIQNGQVLRQGKRLTASDVEAVGGALAGGERQALAGAAQGQTGIPVLDAARRTTREIKEFENLAGFIDDRIIKKTPDLRHYTIDLRSLDKMLDPENLATLSKRDRGVAAFLKQNPLIRSEIQQFEKAVGEIKLDPGILTKLNVVEAISQILIAPQRSARERAMRILTKRKGKVLTPTDFIAAFGSASLGAAQRAMKNEEQKKEMKNAIQNLVY